MKMLRLLVLFALLPLPLFANADPVEVAHSLAHQNLIYKYGADDPSTGGLDCSGFMMVAFKQSWNINLPDQAGKQFEYIRQNGEVWDATTSFWTQKTLKPGDLIFWTGTYKCNRPSPITHVMMYLGNNTMVGAQNHGKRIDTGTAGVGYYYFKPRPPQGNPYIDQTKYREGIYLYAYGRLKKPDPLIALPVLSLPTVSGSNIEADPNKADR